MMRWTSAVLLLILWGCESSTPETVTPEDVIDPENPEWRFEVFEPAVADDVTFTSVWTNERGDAFVAGWFGTILTNRSGEWERMPTPTDENLTAIAGENNGRRFGLEENADGEMFAVGWSGTVLYYHPDPNGDEDPSDGEWRKIAGPGGESPSFFSPLTRIDPACPDADGDGIADDGNGDGWSGNAGGVNTFCGMDGVSAAACDDNCRELPNGPDRPLADTNTSTVADTGCLGPGDLPVGNSQTDADMDGIGTQCDDDDSVAAEGDRFTETLFDLDVDRDGDTLSIVAVGGNGSIVSFNGESNSANPGSGMSALEDARNWVAQAQLPFRFSTDDDCLTGDLVADATTGGCGGLLYPSCAAQCGPAKTTCECAPTDGQCCDPAASTGAGCAAGVDSCGPAFNACAGDGDCTTACPECFRRMAQTLRSVAVSDTRIVAVGSRGTIAVLDTSAGPDALMDTWAVPACPAPAPPLDENPLLTLVGTNNGNFVTGGAAGALFNLNIGEEDCPATAVNGVPPAFLSDVVVVGGNRFFAVGDNGLFLEVRGGNATVIPTQIEENFLAIRRSRFPNPDPESEGETLERFWLVGATGRIVRAGFF
ncbi:MAG: hypothetical protein AAFU77_00405 [Myxococcota bacterium]